MVGQIGCYEIFNTINGKRYLGQSENMEKRFVRHRWELQRGVHHSKKFQRARDKYGESAFKFLPILTCAKSMLDFYEQQLLEKVKPEYNVCTVASSTRGIKHPPRSSDFCARSKAWRTGQTASLEARKNMSKANKGRKFSDESIRKSAPARTGGKRTPEAKKRMSDAHIGKKRSPESIKKGVDTRRAMADPKSPPGGKTIKQRLAADKRFETHRDFWVGPTKKEHSARVSIDAQTQTKTRVRAKASSEAKKRMSDAHIGEKLSPETCRKISEGVTASWGLRRKAKLTGEIDDDN